MNWTLGRTLGYGCMWCDAWRHAVWPAGIVVSASESRDGPLALFGPRPEVRLRLTARLGRGGAGKSTGVRCTDSARKRRDYTSMTRSSLARLSGTVLMAGGLLVGPLAANSGAKAAAPTWVSTKGKVVSLTLIAGYNNNGSGFNFNGASKGQLTVTIPLGDTVNVLFSNKASLPHSAQVVAFSKNPPASTVPDAFKGANSANPTNGVAAGKAQKFTFLANKAGTYLIICALERLGLATAVQRRPSKF